MSERVWLMEESADGGKTWKLANQYGVYKSLERCVRRAASQNLDTWRKDNGFRCRPVEYQRTA